jgi:hypothetical protein
VRELYAAAGAERGLAECHGRLDGLTYEGLPAAYPAMASNPFEEIHGAPRLFLADVRRLACGVLLLIYTPKA